MFFISRHLSVDAGAHPVLNVDDQTYISARRNYNNDIVIARRASRRSDDRLSPADLTLAATIIITTVVTPLPSPPRNILNGEMPFVARPAAGPIDINNIRGVRTHELTPEVCRAYRRRRYRRRHPTNVHKLPSE